MAQEHPLHLSAWIFRSVSPEILQDGGRLIAGAIVYDDDLDAGEERRFGKNEQTSQAGFDQVLLVVNGNDDGESYRLRRRRRRCIRRF